MRNVESRYLLQNPRTYSYESSFIIPASPFVLVPPPSYIPQMKC